MTAREFRVLGCLAGRDEDGEDAVRARGRQVHGRLGGGAVRVSEEKQVQRVLLNHQDKVRQRKHCPYFRYGPVVRGSEVVRG